MEVECVDLTAEDVSEPDVPTNEAVESSSYDVDSLDEGKTSEGNELTSSVDEKEVAELKEA